MQVDEKLDQSLKVPKSVYFFYTCENDFIL